MDLLDRVGPGRFAARLDHAGIRLRFPRGSAPGLPLILGGTGATLEDLVGAHAALMREGRAGRQLPTCPMWARTCSALETLNSPGASTNKFRTTPSSAYRAKRLARTPMP